MFKWTLLWMKQLPLEWLYTQAFVSINGGKINSLHSDKVFRVFFRGRCHTQRILAYKCIDRERRNFHIAVIQRLYRPDAPKSLFLSEKMFSTQAFGDTGKMKDYHYSGPVEHRFSPYAFNGGWVWFKLLAS